MAVEFDLNELQKRRRKKKTKNFAKKLVAFLVIAALGVTAYLLRDKWLPFFEGIGSRYGAALQNSGELAEGNFPILVAEQTFSYQTGTTDTTLVYLDDTHMRMYSEDGMIIADRQLGYSAPILKFGGKRALVYDSGGKEFRVESKQKTVFEKTMDNNIIFARIGANDMTAAVTESDSYACVLNVFNPDGSDCYTLKNADGRITDMTFKRSGTGCVLSSIGVSGGKLVSTLYSYSFNAETADWQSSAVDTFVMSVNILDNGNIAAVGDTKCVFLSPEGNVIGEYVYPSRLIDYDCNGKIASFLFENEELREYTAVIVSDISVGGISTDIGKTAKSIQVDGDNTLVLTSDGITAYSPDGLPVVSVTTSDEYIDFVKSGDYVFLKGYTEINRIDFIC